MGEGTVTFNSLCCIGNCSQMALMGVQFALWISSGLHRPARA